jgi:hypothetical protein
LTSSPTSATSLCLSPIKNPNRIFIICFTFMTHLLQKNVNENIY